MDSKDFISLCKRHLVDYYKKEYNQAIFDEDMYVVWSCKTLQNNKALLSTIYPDDMYFEFTYNGDKCEMYLDAYKKEKNVCISLLCASADN